MWDFWSLNPESLHQVMFLMSDRGTPFTYRHMHGFGSHTFSFINAENERVFVKFHFKSAQGIKNFENDAASTMKGHDAEWAQRDLVNAIDTGDFPKWNMKIQIMTEAETKEFPFNPFDLTKVWPHADFPLIDVGVLELNEVPKNYFQDVEQAAFAPANIIDGIGFSPDRMLQGRILSYPDAHRHRLGVNYEQIPVNRCPYMVANYHRDGAMRIDGNGESNANYRPNSFDNIEIDNSYKEPAMPLDSLTADWFDRNAAGENDHYTQPGTFWRKVLSPQDKKNLVKNIVGAMSGISGPKREIIVQRQLCHFFRADIGFGMAVAQAMGVNIDPELMSGHESSGTEKVLA